MVPPKLQRRKKDIVSHDQGMFNRPRIDNGIRLRNGTSGLAAGNECSLAFMHIFRLGTCLNFSFPRDKSVPLISSFCLCFYLLPSVFANPVKERKKTVKAETTFVMVLSFTFPLIFSRPNV